MIPTKDELIELFFRSLWTAVKAFTGGLFVNGTGLIEVDSLALAGIAAGSAVVSVLHVYAAQKLEGPTAARLLGRSA